MCSLFMSRRCSRSTFLHWLPNNSPSNRLKILRIGNCRDNSEIGVKRDSTQTLAPTKCMIDRVLSAKLLPNPENRAEKKSVGKNDEFDEFNGAVPLPAGDRYGEVAGVEGSNANSFTVSSWLNGDAPKLSTPVSGESKPQLKLTEPLVLHFASGVREITVFWREW